MERTIIASSFSFSGFLNAHRKNPYAGMTTRYARNASMAMTMARASRKAVATKRIFLNADGVVLVSVYRAFFTSLSHVP